MRLCSPQANQNENPELPVSLTNLSWMEKTIAEIERKERILASFKARVAIRAFKGIEAVKSVPEELDFVWVKTRSEIAAVFQKAGRTSNSFFKFR